MSAHLYVEGSQVGANSREQQTRAREAITKLLKKMGLEQMPRISCCGGRLAVFDKFQTALKQSDSDYIAMLIDSEDPVYNLEETWVHLKKRDNWDKPEHATNEQILFMTTCVETWIVADRKTLKEHYRKDFQESSLPPLDNLEKRVRGDVQGCLIKATKKCSNAYEKGGRSFKVLSELDPEVLSKYLPSFARIQRILDEKLK